MSEEVLSPDQFKDHPHRKHYLRGWKAGEAPSEKKIENADRRREHPAWYVGFYDRESREEKFKGLKDL